MTDRVTLKDVYDIVERLENKMDSRLQRDETRLENMENFQSRAIGIISVVMFFVSATSSYVWDKVLGRR